MPNGSWQPDPYGRHQMRWFDGARWTSMVSDNGVVGDENAPQQTTMQQPPVQQPAMQPPTMQQAAVPQQWPAQPPLTAVVPPTAPKRNTALIAIVAVLVLVGAAVAVFLLTKDDGGDTATGTTATTSSVTTTPGSAITSPVTSPVTPPFTGTGGHDSQTPEGQAYVDAMMETSDDSGFTDTEARCIAEGSIDVIGVQTLRDAGVTPEMMAEGGELLSDFEPSEAQANALNDMMFACVDFGALMTVEMGVGVLPAEQVACIGDALETDEVFRSFLVSSMLGAEDETGTTDDMVDLQNALMDIMVGCGVDLSGAGG